MEALALSKVSLAIYSSEWAAQTAVKNYNIDKNKVKVVPFGANIECDRTGDDIQKTINSKSFDVCKLLFIGVDWDRKGGDTALAVTRLLNNKGITTELHVVGCEPVGIMTDFVKKHGFISKKNADGRNYINRLMAESHFLILPSKAECYGVVFAEASSFGLPSLASKTGGITAAIRDGKNGRTFSLSDGPKKYCEFIEGLISSPDDYNSLSMSSFGEFLDRLNWSTAVKEVISLMKEVV